MKPQNHSIFESVISKPRLDSYKNYFKTKTQDEAVGLYMWNCELTSNLSVILGFIEIALRNSVHLALTAHYAGNPLPWYEVIYPSMKKEGQKKLDAILKDKNGIKFSPPPKPDKVVSELMFGFWPFVIKNIGITISHKLMPKIFKNHSLNAIPINWNNHSLRNLALQPLYEINAFRNRIAHHEPIWKFSAIKDMSVNPPVTIFPASSNFGDTKASFAYFLKLMDDVASSIDKDFSNDLMNSSWRKSIDYLLTDRGFNKYRSSKYFVEKNISPTEVKKSFNLIIAKNQPVRIKRGERSGILYPE